MPFFVDGHGPVGAAHAPEAFASAFNDCCAVFQTSDQEDIGHHRGLLEGLLGLRAFHNPTGLADAIAFILKATGGSYGRGDS